MDFKQLLSEIKKHPVQELRAHSDDYFEAVFSISHVTEAESVLVSYFGVPIKPAGLSPSRDADHFSKPYGGIRKNQTMYLRQQKDGNEVAFLWPWGDGALVTVKIIAEKKHNGAAPFPKQSLFKSLLNLFIHK